MKSIFFVLLAFWICAAQLVAQSPTTTVSPSPSPIASQTPPDSSGRGYRTSTSQLVTGDTPKPPPPPPRRGFASEQGKSGQVDSNKSTPAGYPQVSDTTVAPKPSMSDSRGMGQQGGKNVNVPVAPPQSNNQSGQTKVEYPGTNIPAEPPRPADDGRGMGKTGQQSGNSSSYGGTGNHNLTNSGQNPAPAPPPPPPNNPQGNPYSSDNDDKRGYLGKEKSSTAEKSLPKPSASPSLAPTP